MSKFSSTTTERAVVEWKVWVTEMGSLPLVVIPNTVMKINRLEDKLTDAAGLYGAYYLPVVDTLAHGNVADCFL